MESFICKQDVQNKRSYTKMTAPVSLATTLINIDNYTKKFEEYPSDFVEFAKKCNIPLLALTTMKGQALALMAQPDLRGQKHLTRLEAEKFFKNIGMETDDAIQQFNKETGFKRIEMKGKYCLQYPFESDTTNLEKRKGVCISGDRDTAINTIKKMWMENLVNVPNNLWQIGHLDPTIADASEKNLAYQPHIQAKFRDRFKWCPFFQRMWPTAKELIPNFKEYYTEAERKEILKALKEELEK
jgi:hypothetical protein